MVFWAQSTTRDYVRAGNKVNSISYYAHRDTDRSQGREDRKRETSHDEVRTDRQAGRQAGGQRRRPKSHNQLLVLLQIHISTSRP